jgi:hypothetical protein
MQWFHFHDPRLDEAVAWMKRLGTRRIRTGLSWADSFREGALDWFDRQMEALADFDVTVTFCFTPAHLGIEPHHTSPARDPQAFADFCAWMIDRYADTATIAPAADPVTLATSQPELNPLLFNRDERLAGAELGEGDLVEVQGLAGVLVPRLLALEHVDLVLVDRDGPVGLGEGESGEVLGRGFGGHRVENLLHVRAPVSGWVWRCDRECYR